MESGVNEKGLEDAMRGRLNRLDYYFTSLSLKSEACRLRLLCEMMKNPLSYYPLTDVLLDETR